MAQSMSSEHDMSQRDETIWASLLSVGVALLFLHLLFSPPICRAQTRDSGAVSGVVADSSGASIAGADVEISNSETAVLEKTKTDAQGDYFFASVPPGNYTITAKANGFRGTAVHVQVDVAKSIQENITLQVGQVTETVEIKTRAIELQTTDSSVGEVIESNELAELPTTQRKASELIYLQPATAPLVGSGSASVTGIIGGMGGGVAGARPDQNSATLDGVLVADEVEGGYGSGFGGNIALFPMPVDAVQEFRGVVSNSDAPRSSGGQYSFTTRTGTNNWHGTAYWFDQNSAANANDWTDNFYGVPRAHAIDNRVGGRVGGPIWKNKTFFSFFYEARRYPNYVDGSRTGISETMRTGILRFDDASGNAVSYNLNPANGPISNLCGTGQSCDSRGIGFNPVIQQLFKLYPVANAGEGLNTGGIFGSVSDSQTDDTALVRLDHNLNSKWRLTGTYMWQSHRLDNPRQIDFNPNVTGGALLKTTASTQLKPEFVSIGATAQLSPRLTFDFRLGWVRQNLNNQAVLPQTLIPAAGSPLLLTGNESTILDSPGDPDSNAARPRIGSEQFRSANGVISWLHGNHIFATNVHLQWIESYTAQFNQGGSLSESPVAQITTGKTYILPSSDRPPTCDPTGTPAIVTNCLNPGDIKRWNALYGVLLGIWDNTRSFDKLNANGTVASFGPVSTDMRWKHLDIAGADTWRIRPALTLSYGIALKVETPLSEKDGKQALFVNAGTGTVIDPHAEIKAKLAAAAMGDVFNQTYAYEPIGNLHRSLYSNVVVPSPRVGIAWNPSFEGGLLDKVFGKRKTVLRGGYSLMWDNMLAAEAARGQLLGNPVSVNSPTCEAAGSPGLNCISGVSPFRIGIDGVPFPPTPTGVTIPYIPAAATAANRNFGDTSGIAIDPNLTVGHIHSVNFTVQRDLPGGFFVEAGWIGNYARNLTVSLNDTAPPVNIRDLSHKSNQTFAQAYDALATQLRAGVNPSAVTPQPWFENLYGSGGTAQFANADPSDIIAGALTPLFQQILGNNLPGIDAQLLTLGMPPIDNQQFAGLVWYSNGAWSNYNAMFITLRSRAWRGLTSNFNYTWSHCLDSGASNESEGNHVPNSYNLRYNYGDCWTDSRHRINLYGTYNLPSATKLKRLLGGWNTSYILTWYSGNPLLIYNTMDEFGQMNSGDFSLNTVPVSAGVNTSTGVVGGISGSDGIGINGAPANGGTGLNLFHNPEQVFNSLRPPLLSTDTGTSRGAFRGLGYFGLDFSVGKQIIITERFKARISVDAFNVLNYVNFASSSPSLQDPADFGVIFGQVSPDPLISGDSNVGPRRLQAGLRFEF